MSGDWLIERRRSTTLFGVIVNAKDPRLAGLRVSAGWVQIGGRLTRNAAEPAVSATSGRMTCPLLLLQLGSNMPDLLEAENVAGFAVAFVEKCDYLDFCHQVVRMKYFLVESPPKGLTPAGFL